MDWYYALTEHLLNRDYVNESFGSILPQLKAKTLALYRALLLYQMKSVCSYYRHQGLVFLRGLTNWDDWDDNLKTVTNAEATLQRDSDQYNKHHAKSALAQCRWDLRVIDLKDDIKKIKMKKDTLLADAYDWILNTEHAIAALRSLVWMLLVAQPHLITHLRKNRPEVDVIARLKTLNTHTRDISESLVELDAQILAGPVNVYINHKLSTLKGRRLSKLYDHMMTRIKKVEEVDPQDCKRILVCAALAFRPLSVSELAALSAMPDDITVTAIELCGSFLATREETVYLIHQSAKNYLDENFALRLQPSGAAQGHADIARRSIEAMSAADHLVGNGESPECNSALAFTFLKQSLLHWLESLSLLGKLPEGMQTIRKLLHIAQKSSASSEPARFLEDVKAFIRSHGSIIERAPLQIYASALVFSPATSEMVAGIKAHWDAHRQTLEGHNGWVTAVAFSPDGRYLTTNLGSLQLSSTTAPSEHCSDGNPPGHTLNVDNEWIALGGKESLWLPADYRASAVALHGNKMVLGHQSGGLFSFPPLKWKGLGNDVVLYMVKIATRDEKWGFATMTRLVPAFNDKRIYQMYGSAGGLSKSSVTLRGQGHHDANLIEPYSHIGGGTGAGLTDDAEILAYQKMEDALAMAEETRGSTVSPDSIATAHHFSAYFGAASIIITGDCAAYWNGRLDNMGVIRRCCLVQSAIGQMKSLNPAVLQKRTPHPPFLEAHSSISGGIRTPGKSLTGS
ncbi:beta transducin-like protein HET-D2Y [Metarhizium acridum CQMa 102]|uniref:Beta transducin-like protein HET-D2Y n=1 Tax=Metarhizium acridum (strain CQMa 102) TaxID=655827 RepID=E9EGP5_METAQ|nr:beta transducin-like protein HET-D2Y [Metarhizium acridum CQMa 102]EFY84901.1 beta transducin-like protein HET-D2Y [Metarhizium acridum CQMa 102]